MTDFPLKPGDTTTEAELRAMFPDAIFVGWPEDEAEDDDEDDATYSIVRFKFMGESEVMQTGLTLDEAQEHCQRDDTHGDGWFDGYRAE